MDEDLADLVRRAAGGSEAAREELLRLYGPHIRRVVRRKLECAQQALFDSRDFVGELWPSLFAASRLEPHAGDRPQTVIDVLTDTICTQVVDAFRQDKAHASLGHRHGKSGCPLILVVEDEEAVRRLLDLALRGQGFGVQTAAGGQEAVEFYRHDPASIDLVLLDVQMTGWDGPQTLAALREIDPAVRCCFMSGCTGSYSPEELLRLGAATVISKPFPSLDELGRRLRQIIGGS